MSKFVYIKNSDPVGSCKYIHVDGKYFLSLKFFYHAWLGRSSRHMRESVSYFDVIRYSDGEKIANGIFDGPRDLIRKVIEGDGSYLVSPNERERQIRKQVEKALEIIEEDSKITLTTTEE